MSPTPASRPWLALAALVLLLPLAADAATWVPLYFTAPPGATRYFAERIWKDGRAPIVLRSAPSGTAPALVPSSAAQETAWVYITAAGDNAAGWRNGGQGIHAAFVDSAGQISPWSNLVIVAAGVPADTNFRDLTGASWRGGDGWARSRPSTLDSSTWVIQFTRSIEDSVMYASRRWPCINGWGPVIHQQDLMRLDREHPSATPWWDGARWLDVTPCQP